MILFCCVGNAFQSPLLAALYNAEASALGLSARAMSAGLTNRRDMPPTTAFLLAAVAQELRDRPAVFAALSVHQPTPLKTVPFVAVRGVSYLHDPARKAGDIAQDEKTIHKWLAPAPSTPVMRLAIKDAGYEAWEANGQPALDSPAGQAVLAVYAREVNALRTLTRALVAATASDASSPAPASTAPASTAPASPASASTAAASPAPANPAPASTAPASTAPANPAPASPARVNTPPASPAPPAPKAAPLPPTVVRMPTPPAPKPAAPPPTVVRIPTPPAPKPAPLPTVVRMPTPPAGVPAARIPEPARTDEARVEAARIEAARIEAARIEAARIEAARVEAAREAARVEAARVEAARVAAARAEVERVEAAREAARIAAVRAEAARMHAARIEAARAEAARLEAARIEAAHIETARVDTDKVEADSVAPDSVAADPLIADTADAPDSPAPARPTPRVAARKPRKTPPDPAAAEREEVLDDVRMWIRAALPLSRTTLTRYGLWKRAEQQFGSWEEAVTAAGIPLADEPLWILPRDREISLDILIEALPDANVARLCALSLQKVRARRRANGAPDPARQLYRRVVATDQLGVLPDEAIAAQLGVTAAEVAAIRDAEGIAAPP